MPPVNNCANVRCGRPETPVCQPGETLVTNPRDGCCAPMQKCVTVPTNSGGSGEGVGVVRGVNANPPDTHLHGGEGGPTQLYSTCGILSFLPSSMGGPHVATREDVEQVLSRMS